MNAGGSYLNYYVPVVRYVQADGTTILGPSRMPNDGVVYSQTFTGDYHEIFYWGNRWNNGWAKETAAYAEAAVTGVR